MMRDMTEGPGQQPPQDPRDGASDGGREVLEGLVIPSRRQPRHATQPDPRRDYAAPQNASGEQPSTGGPDGGQSAPAGGPAWSPQAAAASEQTPPAGQAWTAQGLPTRQPQSGEPQIAQAAHTPRDRGAQAPQTPQAQAPQAPQGQGGPQGPQAPVGRGPGPGSRPGAGQDGKQGGVPAQGGPWNAPAGGGGGTPPPSRGTGPGRRGGPPAGPRDPGAGGSGGGTPDWGALAAEQEASSRRRRKVMMLTGAVVAVAVIAGGVATAVVMSGKSSDKAIAKPSSTGNASSQASLPPQPSFSSVAPPPPANPVDYISNAARDKAPITPGSLFPGKQFLMDGRVYVKTAATTTTSCAGAARSTVATALTANGCRQLVRATYTNGGVAVTVGVAVFADTAHASKLRTVAQYLAPLNGGGVHDFCHAVACRMTSNSIGRYAYFAISGLKDGKTITATDKVALLGANDASNFAFQRIIQRGRDAAAADPSRR
jgi:hypothetical protein